MHIAHNVYVPYQMAIMLIVLIPRKNSRKFYKQIKSPVTHRHIDEWRNTQAFTRTGSRMSLRG